MQEVTIRLRLLRPCLGYVQRRTGGAEVIYAMPRDPEQRVTFLASWWRGGLLYAAKVLNRYQSLAPKVAWDSVVQGRLGQYKRTVLRLRSDGTVKGRGYARHEAFRAGDEITVQAVVPTGLSIEAFTELLTLFGRYKGISPYQSEEETYGTFTVSSVQPTREIPVERPVPAPSVIYGTVVTSLRDTC